jgi:hypothetical protein
MLIKTRHCRLSVSTDRRVTPGAPVALTFGRFLPVTAVPVTSGALDR